MLSPTIHEVVVIIVLSILQGSKDEEDGEDDGDEAQVEDKEFRNSDIVGSYAFAYGNEATVAAAKEVKRFEKLMKFAPKVGRR